jgi:hypothetical protein
VLTVGHLSALDIFDDNAFSHDTRTQFMNLSLITHGAYDFAGDTRGYSRGFALDYYRSEWVIRAGRLTQPKQPHERALDARIFRHYGDQIEIERAHEIRSQPGALRVLAFRNCARCRVIGTHRILRPRAGGRPTSMRFVSGSESSTTSV